MTRYRSGPSTSALALVFLLSLLSAACHPVETGREGHSAAEDMVGRTPADLVNEWIQMWNSYDLNRVGELFLADDRVTYFSSEYEGVIRGFDAVLEHHRGFGFIPGGEDRGNRLWVEGLTEDVLGEAAVLTGIWFFRRESEATPPQRGPVTFVSVLEEGEWRFAHMNFGKYLEAGEGEG